MPPPRAFISYSWDDEEHKTWVSNLATELRQDGVETRLDQWHAALGDQFTAFMEGEIRDNDFVLVVCTPNYRVKSNQRTGGVGYEGDIMTAEVAAGGDHRKYIPVLARGTWSEAAPTWLSGKHYVDFRTADSYERDYPRLVDTLLGCTPPAPPIGSGRRSTGSARRRLPARSTPDDRSPRALPHGGRASRRAESEEPIKIVRVMTDEVTTPTQDGTPGSALYAVPLGLNRRPSQKWAELFVANWNHPPRFSSMHRPRIASVKGDRIVLNGTTVDEIKKHHRDTLTLCVDLANQQESAILQRQRSEEERRRRQVEDHRKEVEESAKGLSFD